MSPVERYIDRFPWVRIGARFLAEGLDGTTLEEREPGKRYAWTVIAFHVGILSSGAGVLWVTGEADTLVRGRRASRLFANEDLLRVEPIPSELSSVVTTPPTPSEETP